MNIFEVIAPIAIGLTVADAEAMHAELDKCRSPSEAMKVANKYRKLMQ